MIQTDDNTPALIAAATQNPQAVMPKDEFGQTMLAADSIKRTIADSVKNLQLSDIKDVVTGENTILKDGLHALTELTVGFVPKLLIAILILWVGMKLAKMLKKVIIKALDKRGAEASLKTFLASLVDLLLKAMIVIMAMDVVGIKATSFIALLGAMGLAIGMALQGTLQNFAGGVIILLMKPFKVGDYIECGSYKGYIKEIRIFHTIMRPFNGRTIIIPNSDLATKSLINHTREEVIRLDIIASVAYGTDLAKAKQVILDVVYDDPLVRQEPKAPIVAVSALNNSSVDFSIWIWVTVDDYWTLWMRIRENLYNAFYKNGISIPFPQMDVHLDYKENQPAKKTETGLTVVDETAKAKDLTVTDENASRQGDSIRIAGDTPDKEIE
ncbi:MAG: mechanosensitive ion channel family protein [Bacteroidales bacterium]|nr:mechanosensitive ion channel family protein [Bacteroidales bacterium]